MLDKVTTGPDVPHELHVVIEIPANSKPVKYEVDKKTGVLFVDRFMTSCMRYPCDYGYIPKTLGEDGDPLDALVISPYPLISGSVIRVRPVGQLKMTDESGGDTKILMVPASSVTPTYNLVQKPEDLSPLLLQQIEFFFLHYKELEVQKWVKIQGWGGVEEAKAEILASVARYTED